MKIPPSLIAVANRLGPLRERVVFVGGMIRGLLVTDPAATPPRPTDDVDLIVDVPSHPTNNSLTLEFHGGGFYRYAGVARETYEGLLRAYSAGQYFHQWIKDRYPSTRAR